MTRRIMGIATLRRKPLRNILKSIFMTYDTELDRLVGAVKYKSRFSTAPCHRKRFAPTVLKRMLAIEAQEITVGRLVMNHEVAEGVCSIVVAQ